MTETCDEQKVFDGMLEPLLEALEATKDDKVKIHSCEIVGGPSRVPVAQRHAGKDSQLRHFLES